MKKSDSKPLTQVEMNRRYREKHNLVLFSVRIEKNLYDSLCAKLNQNGLNKKEFLADAIENFLNR